MTTKTKKKYSDKLKNPRWQKLRLKVLNRDEWRCTCCGEDQEMLVVHHLVYRPNKEPWEYAPSELTTFCQKCHKYEHALLTMAKVGINLDSAGV